MDAPFEGYQRILVATDFSPFAQAALRQAVWVARCTGAPVVLVHALRDLRKAVHYTSVQARMDLLYGTGETFQREIRRHSDAKMREAIAALGAADLDITCETVLGEAAVGVTHVVQQEHYDLVLAGTRGHSPWQQMLVGSVAKRLIRKCPADVWITKSEHAGPPRTVLALADFSPVSRKAALHASWIARQAGAALHLLHVIDSNDVPDDLISQLPQHDSLRDEINREAQSHLDSFVASLGPDAAEAQLHLSWGTPWKEIARTAQHLGANLVALGTVGRTGIPGMLLGNTAERVLDHCDCSMLTAKPEGFVSPISPVPWPLHPPRERAE